jgi:phosphatidate cytidylyltransferase
VLFLLPPAATLALATLAILLGAWEWSALIPPQNGPPRWLLPVVLALLMAWWWRSPPDAAAARVLLAVATLWWLVAMLWVVLAPGRGHPVLTALACPLSLAPLWVAAAVLRGSDRHGAWIVLLALAIVVAADTGAYFAGRAFGRVKLAPQVSPGKTWEGVIGGLLASALVAWAGARWLGWPVQQILPLALTAAGLSVVGDLLESKMKRQAGVKDSGHLFPGHGGVLDRIDSLAAGLPVLALGFTWFGWLP